MAPCCLSLHCSISMEFTTFHSKYLKRPAVIALKGHASGFASYNPFLLQIVLLWTCCSEHSKVAFLSSFYYAPLTLVVLPSAINLSKESLHLLEFAARTHWAPTIPVPCQVLFSKHMITLINKNSVFWQKSINVLWFGWTKQWTPAKNEEANADTPKAAVPWMNARDWLQKWTNACETLYLNAQL